MYVGCLGSLMGQQRNVGVSGKVTHRICLRPIYRQAESLFGSACLLPFSRNGAYTDSNFHTSEVG